MAALIVFILMAKNKQSMITVPGMSDLTVCSLRQRLYSSQYLTWPDEIGQAEYQISQVEEELWEAKQAGKNKTIISEKAQKLDNLQMSLDTLYDMSDNISDEMLGLGKKVVKRKRWPSVYKSRN